MKNSHGIEKVATTTESSGPAARSGVLRASCLSADAGFRFFGAIATGLLLTVAFPPWQRTGMVWVALVPLLLVARFSRPWVAFRWGWLSGTLYWLLAGSWMLRMGQTRISMAAAVALWAGLALYLGLHIGGFAGLASMLFGRTVLLRTVGGALAQRSLSRAAELIGLPMAWVGWEYARGAVFTGIPWNVLGIALCRNVPMIQIAEWGGAYAVSGLIAFVNVAFAVAVLRVVDSRRRGGLRPGNPYELVLAVFLVAVCRWHGEGLIEQRSSEARAGVVLQVLAVQPNIPPRGTDEPTRSFENLRRLERQTLLGAVAQPVPDLIVWPEASVPSTVVEASSAPRALVERMCRIAPVLVGTMERRVRHDQRVWLNTSMLFDGGASQQRYHKLRPVPFGEYIPLSGLLRRLGVPERLPLTVTCGTRQTLFRLNPSRFSFAVLICSEDIIPGLARQAVRTGAQFLVNQTNDAWFDPSAESLQHMQHAIFRCVENRIPVVRCANTGISCGIDAVGRVSVLRGRDGRMAQVEGFQRMGMLARDCRCPFTLYTRFGDALFAIPCAIGTVLLLIGEFLRDRS